MDVVRLTLLLASFVFLISCAKEGQKTPESVFANKTTANNCQAEAIENQYIVHWEDGTFTKEQGENEENFRKGFVTRNLDKIKKVHFDHKVQFYTKDELSASSESLAPYATTTADQVWGQAIIQADQVWQKNAKGKNIIVGIVDSYVDVTHSKLKDQILINTKEIPNNGKDDDENGYIDDYSSANFTNVTNYTIQNVHGTHVAGIVAADHSGMMKGIAPEAKIVAAPFISNDGSGSLGDAINAMNYVVSRGAKVINASWGGSVCVATLRDAFQEISKKGVLIVVAAGNESRDLDFNPTYPAAFNISGQITVGASNYNDYMTSFSNSSFNLVHLAAPGDDILSTTPNEKYEYLKGTSMAAPFVTGAAAALWSAFPDMTSLQIKEALVKSVDVIPNHEFRVASRGRLNLLKAYNYLAR
ncbi:MAG: S8 family serine peptidase [Bdellovibrionaceae bacterium]|nr:S8 family serine peptidase [Pseudobdellovibrionaceae bacterium]